MDADFILMNKLADVETNYLASAIPWRCWGRGCRRPELSELSLSKFLGVSADDAVKKSIKVNDTSTRLPTKKLSSDNIMENITKQCNEVLGKTYHEEEIATWLKKRNTFESKIYGSNTENYENSASDNLFYRKNANGAVRKEFLNKSDTKSLHRLKDNFHHDNLMKNKDMENCCNYPDFMKNHFYQTASTELKQNAFSEFPHSTHDDDVLNFTMQRTDLENDMHHAEIEHVNPISNPNLELLSFHQKEIRKQKCITLKNLSENIRINDLRDLLNGFGTVADIVIVKEANGDNAANVRMNKESECQSIVDCLNGSYASGAFGGRLHISIQETES